jgi:hypothetical protein
VTPEPKPLNTVYECAVVTDDPNMYGLRTAELNRADGFAGWLRLTGTELAGLEVGRKYRVTVEECD